MKNKLIISIKRDDLKRKEFDKARYEKLDNNNPIYKDEENLIKIFGYIYKEDYLND